ncbi:phytanoyl-CoA dioxygenase family protein [Acinetobacter terrae]|uniref:Phytanoyl-CoA dioxygenase family protein n=1 Tax=Acinetobacter terrae TaxID=2731247 RepID=A0A4V2LP29_9GAMM|nr:phytanoyl-CoA dioxygenase family protein [Acinetobacter terrae]TCB54789.1 phytanoyl-CoA dioxygenase family protein [Acinetobacter terrae]
MAKELVTLPATASVEDVVAIMQRDGGVIVEDMISTDVLKKFWDDLSPYLDQTPYGVEGFAGPKTKRCCALMAKSMQSQHFITQQHFLGAARDYLEEDYEFLLSDKTIKTTNTTQLSVSQAIQIWPGQKAQVLHRDDHLHHRKHPGPESQIQVLYAGTDFTEENGATLVIPGSHLWDDQRIPKKEEAIPAVMKKGSGLIYCGSLYHAGGENRSNEARTAIAFSICRGYLRQEENQYLVVPREIVLKYPKEVQDLLGYKVCEPFCGWVEMSDPSIVLQQADITTASAKNLF